MPKMPPCCARVQYRTVTNKAEVARLAKNAARFAASGKSTTKTLEAIETAKASLAVAQQAEIEHEATHAGETEVA